MELLNRYLSVRKFTEDICKPLEIEDYVIQPIVDVSPPKWHIGHTTWFFETFILKPFLKNYTEFNPLYNYVFNSYYETVGARVIRTDRGNLSRPTVSDVFRYRKHVDDAMKTLWQQGVTRTVNELLVLGINHEQQHQELLRTDIKYILGNNPLFPAYEAKEKKGVERFYEKENKFIKIEKGIYEIGYDGDGFCFDNELKRHPVYLCNFFISKELVTNSEYLQFVNDGGYENFKYWHADGWEWVKSNSIKSPMYWHLLEDKWNNYTLNGLLPLNLNEPVNHVNFYEASAFASWKGLRLPTEFEWEVAANNFDWGLRWEWTESAYVPYPGFAKAPGAIGEYNGKFMVNQKVLRGASEVTSPGHSRITYRNFFQPNLRWQYTGIRLAY